MMLRTLGDKPVLLGDRSLLLLGDIGVGMSATVEIILLMRWIEGLGRCLLGTDFCIPRPPVE
jgi:hypothetical protein